MHRLVLGNAKENAAISSSAKNVVAKSTFGSVKKLKALSDVKNTVHSKAIDSAKKASKGKEQCTPFKDFGLKEVSQVAAKPVYQFEDEVVYECKGCKDNNDFDDVWQIPVPRLTAAEIAKFATEPFPSPKGPYSPVPMSPILKDGISDWIKECDFSAWSINRPDTPIEFEKPDYDIEPVVWTDDEDFY